MKGILTIFKKELMRFFTDKRMLVSLILPGVLIFCVYSLMGTFMEDLMTGGTSGASEYIVYIDNQPSEFAPFNNPEDMTITVKANDTTLTAEQKKEAVKNSDAHLYIVYEQDFYNKMLAYDVASNTPAPHVELFFNSASMDSQTIYSYYVAVLDSIEQSISNKMDINRGNAQYDLASESEITTYILSTVLPMLLNALLLTGCMMVCSESVAGEKERGTIASLLVTPVKRSHLALGKVLALALVALVSATSSFVGLLCSLPSLMGVSITALPYGVGEYMMLFGIIALNVLLFTVILTLISTLSKSVKEAQGFASPVMILVMVLSIVSSFLPMEGLVGYFIPVLNSVLCLTSVISMSFNLAGFFITLGINAVIFVLGVLLLGWLFNNEKVMFNK